MAIVNELITKFGFIGNLAPQESFNANLKASIGLLAGLGTAIQGSAGAMAAWFTSIIDGLDPLVQFHRETGLSVEGLQELGRVAALNGSSMEAVTDSIGEMTMRIGEFVSTGEGEMADIAKRLGMSFKDAQGNVKGATQTFTELSDKIRGMSQAEKFSVLDKMGIDRSMVQMLSLSREELDKSLKQARDWGVVTTEQADAAAEFNNSLKDLRMGYSSVSTQVALSFLPMLKDVIDSMREWLHANADLIKNGLHQLGEIIFSVAGMIRRLLPLITLAVAGFTIWKIAAFGLGNALKLAFSPVLLITAAIVGILLVIDDLVVAMQGGKSVIADFFMDNWGIDIVPALKAAKAALMAFIDYAINIFKPLADAIASMFKMVWHLITGAFTGDFQDAMNDAQNIFDSLIAFITGAIGVVGDAIKYVFGDAGVFVVNTFTIAIKNIKLIFSAMWKFVTGDFEGAWNDVTQIFMNAIKVWKTAFSLVGDTVKYVFGHVGVFISDMFSAVVDSAKLIFSSLWQLVKSGFEGAWDGISKVFMKILAQWRNAINSIGDTVKNAFGDAGTFIIDTFATAIENTKLIFSALWKLVAGDFEGAWGDVVKIFDNGVELMKKPFTAFIDWAKNIFAGLGEYIGNIISNAASNAWNATKSFFGFGGDEQQPQQGMTGGGNSGIGPGGIPYGMNAAVGLGGSSSSYNNSYSSNQQIYVTAPDAVAAGNAVADRTQQQQQDAKRMFSRNGK